MSRIELKFKISHKQAENLTLLVKSMLQTDSYCIEGTPYEVTSLYYDSSNFDMARQSIEGQEQKQKLRIRYYNDDSNKCFAEVKKKNGLKSEKSRVPILKDFKTLFQNNDLPNLESDFNYYYHLYSANPSAIVRYSRMAYNCPYNSQVRLTFDRNIRGRLVNSSSRKSISEEIKLRPLSMYERSILLEIKIGRNIPNWIAHIINQLNSYKVTFSKYSLSLQSLHPHMTA